MLRLLAIGDRLLTGEEIVIMMIIGPHHRSAASLEANRLQFDKETVGAALGQLI